MGSTEKLVTQEDCVCCCGFGKRRNQRGQIVTDGPSRDEIDGGIRLKTCLCCWCMGCDEEGVYAWLKNLLLIYNFAFWLLGCCLVSIGIYSEVMRQRYSTDTGAVFVTPSVILCLIGSFSLIFSTLGGIGALRDNICMLKVFVYSILFFLIAEMACGISALVFKEPAKDFVNRYILTGLTTYYDDQDLRDVVDYMQEEFQCCGGEDYRDWEVNIYHNCTSPGPMACGVPFSCCRRENETIIINTMCGYDTIGLKYYEANQIVYADGCINAVLDWLFLNMNILAGILLGVFLPQVTGIFLGVLYKNSIEGIKQNQKDQIFREENTISLRALDRESVYVDGDKNLSYPIYARRPSVLSDDKYTPTASIRHSVLVNSSGSDSDSLYPELKKQMEAGEVLLQDSPQSGRKMDSIH